jgi:hypothetical protein
MTITRIVIMARMINNVEVKGGEKCLNRVNRKSPIKLSGGPGRIGTILPTNPRIIRIELMTIVMPSSIDLFLPELN